MHRTLTTSSPRAQNSEKQVVVIGGGPAGLTAAHELVTKYGVPTTVLEKLDKVGGISRTENYKGYSFDMGGHRFYTKSKEVQSFWHKILGDEFLLRPRLSRIYYEKKYFNYPLKPVNALLGLGIWQSILVIFSYLRWQLFPYKREESFEEWVTNRFGKRLFSIFFKSYTEKVWGIPTSELKAEWAAQRIKDLSLRTAIMNMFFKNGNEITTLIEQFHYPQRGPGMLWTEVAHQVEQHGGVVQMNSNVVGINRNCTRIESIVVECNGERQIIEGTDFISSMPIPTFIKNLNPPAPEVIQEAAKMLKFRDFLTVCLIVDKPELFPDNWIYIHYPEVKVGRIQNFKNWSPHMVPDPSKTSLGLEYFCNQGDSLWSMSDAELIEQAKRELSTLGIAAYEDIVDGCVFRVDHTYPVYDSDYKQCLVQIREYLETFENFQTIGRNGLHRYNNQDHAMLTAMFAVRNVMLGECNDLWVVNGEQEYHEEIRGKEEVPTGEVTEVVREALAHVFTKLDPPAFGSALGAATGIILFLVTLILVLKGGEVVGPRLQLLSEFLPGYTVTAAGALVGLLYGLALGFIGGWCFAYFRNIAVFIYVAIAQRRAELGTLRKMFDYI
jgi:protoporphyrinogen oxidase